MEQHEDIGTLKDRAISNTQISFEILNDAIGLYNSGRMRSAANRTYYALFKAISAAHALDGHIYKKHKDALGQFNKAYIQHNIFPGIQIKQVYSVLENRQASDYDTVIPPRFIVLEDMHFTKKLSGMIKEYCERHLGKKIETEEILPLEKAITKEFTKESVENYFENLYNQVFEEQCSHDIAAIAAGKSLYRDGCDTVTVLTVLDTVAPKAADNDEYACKILKKIQKDPMIEKIIKEQHKSQVQYNDKSMSL